MAINGNQWQSMDINGGATAINSNQRPSMAINGGSTADPRS
jgi:hypothetical protein